MAMFVVFLRCRQGSGFQDPERAALTSDAKREARLAKPLARMLARLGVNAWCIPARSVIHLATVKKGVAIPAEPWGVERNGN
jgi:hypothetical protein